ncbi:MAG: hypothetical protein ABFS35_18290 [Bacteroidota bacterium]
MRKFFIIIFIVFSTININAQNYNLGHLFSKDSITIVITDSGLGGLSVVAGLENNMRNSGHFAKIKLIFANALFNEKGGYNSLTNRKDKISVFNNVLKGINNKYDPDLILIACNTLSVIYEETPFAKKRKTQIIGIVDIGVEEIHKSLDKETGSKVIIYGTETTIEENNHRSQLIESGVTGNRIITQACPQLQEYIENSPNGEDTEMLIMSYVDEALEKTKIKNEKIYVSLNCTHFGYSKDLWLQAFNFSDISSISIINPNVQMSEILLVKQYGGRFKTDIETKVVSKVKINDKSVKSISGIIKDLSPAASKALLEYQIVSDLF